MTAADSTSNRGQCVLLSIVVPTRNRSSYAIPMVESILALQDDEFELVVSDNSEDDALAQWVAARVPDRRLRYLQVPGRLSMTGNCNWGLSLARGEYVTLIGDDDTVLPSIMAACRWAKEHDVDALTPNLAVRYVWPDFRHRIWGAGQSGRLFVDRWVSAVKEGDPGEQALSCVLRAGQGMGSMANLYHGVVRRSLLEALKQRTGNYCFGVSPDVYLSLSLSSLAKKQLLYCGPLTVPGASGMSNSGRAALRQHKRTLWEDPHMTPYRGETWPEEVPAFFAVETVWAQAALTACRKLGRSDLESRFNFPLLYALCFLHHRGYNAETRRAMRALSGGRVPLRRWLAVLAAVVLSGGRMLLRNLRRVLRPTPRGYSLEYGVFDDVRRAVEFLAGRFPASFCDFPAGFAERRGVADVGRLAHGAADKP